MIEINVAKEESIDVEINAPDRAKPVDVEINGEIYDVGGLTPEEIEKAVEEYLNKNPIASPAKIGYITLLSSEWEGSGNLYKQIVDIEGVTANSQVDLTPDVQQLAIFYEKDLTFVAENEDGIITVYVIGQKPANDYTMQVTITEVLT